jgi:hypothetical protein
MLVRKGNEKLEQLATGKGYGSNYYIKCLKETNIKDEG